MFLAVYTTVDNLKLKVMVMSNVSGLTEMANMQTRITFSFGLWPFLLLHKEDGKYQSV